MLVLPVAIMTLVVALLPKEDAEQQVADLEPAFRELVSFLNRLFSAMGLNVVTFAGDYDFQPGTVHKILKGEEFPPLPFLEALITEVRKVPEVKRPRSLPPISDLRRKSNELRASALQHLNSTEAKVERLQQELSAAEREKNSADTRIAELNGTVKDMEAERAKLMKQLEELARSLNDGLAGPKMIEAATSKMRAESRRESIDTELDALRAKLRREEKARKEAEERGAQLQEALTEANSRLVRSGGSPVELYAHGTGGTFSDRMQYAAINWGRSGRVRTAGLISLVCFGPVYLGLVYHAPHASVFVRLATLYGLAVVVWIAYSAGEALRVGVGSERNLLICVVAAITALFFVGVFIQAVA
ncbi:MAG TPA: hypothetical protein VF157_00350 [Chloroflexota bacterium]